MEPPVSFEPDRLRDETVKVLRGAKRIDPTRVVRGQYDGYRSEPDVSGDSTVETFAALEVEIDSWRWADVPFFLRTGKRLADKVSEVTLKFRNVPYNVFRGTGIDLPRRDHVTIRIQPNEGITIAVNAKKPGPGLELGRVTMDFDYEHEFRAEIMDAYELLLVEAMEGDHTLFLRQDGVERAWELLTPALERPGPVVPYPAGSWGPEEADKLIAPRRWHISGRPHAPAHGNVAERAEGA
jgi:glucose-6-phosphate 1-dehydrogenase